MDTSRQALAPGTMYRAPTKPKLHSGMAEVIVASCRGEDAALKDAALRLNLEAAKVRDSAPFVPQGKQDDGEKYARRDTMAR